MNFDPLFLTIGLSALVLACYLKFGQIKAKREQDRRIREAIEREWGLAEDYNPGKFWPQ